MNKPNRNIQSIYPATPMQQGMLFHSAYSENSGVYIEQLQLTLDQTIDLTEFRRAWQHLIQQYDVLRTCFAWNRNQLLQVVLKDVALPWQDYDWSHMSAAEQQQKLAAWLHHDQQQDFDIAKAPLMRFTLITMGKQQYQFVWTHHHALLDGWSLPILMQDLLSLYEAGCLGKAYPKLETTPYQVYVAWLQRQNPAQVKTYWQQKLVGFSAPTPLPGISPETLQSSSAKIGVEEYDHTLSVELSATVRTWLQQQHISLANLMYAAWGILLSRYSGELDVVFGATVSGRSVPLAGIEDMVGLFINTLPLRLDLSDDCSAKTLLGRLQTDLQELQVHSYTPLLEIQGLSAVATGSRLFDSIVVIENYPIDQALQDNQQFLAISKVEEQEQTNYPLCLAVVPGESLTLRFAYRNDLFTASVITRLGQHLEMLLQGIIDDSSKPATRLPMLTTAEQQLLAAWNNTATDYLQDQCIHQLFEQQVQRTPAAIATVFEDTQSLTYAELNHRANQLAHHLKSMGVGAETLVGLYVDRSLDMLIALLGILKAGGAYVPMDPSYPRTRLEYMLNDAQISILITQTHLAQRLTLTDTHVVCVDNGADFDPQPIDNLQTKVSSDNLAYVIYTSGSTGQPKGVAIPHQGLVNYLSWCVQAYDVAGGQGTLVHSSIGFDATITGLLAPLLVGKPVVLLSPHQEIEALSQALQSHQQLSLVKLTPAHLELLGQMLPPDTLAHQTRALVIGGEALMAHHIAPWQTHAPATRLINEYGPTETVVGCCVYEATSADVSGALPIGRPIANTQLYVLDSHQQPVAIGVSGELYIGGAGVARGYLNRPDLTAEKFISNPFGAGRLYKTGDLARYREDGILEYLGRIDTQVKLRGFRIELGEIEAALTHCQQVTSSVVVLREDTPGNKQLVAYVICDRTPDLAAIKNHLKQQLPSYMVPAVIVPLETLPLTPNGKIDRRALPVPTYAPEPTDSFVAPSTERQQQIATLMADVLSIPVDRIGLHDNFFDLGGHSLLAMRLIARLRQTLEVDLPLKVLFEKPTLAELDAELMEPGRSHMLAITAAKRDGTAIPLSYAQERLWFLAQLEGDSSTYNVPGAVQIDGPLDVAILHRAVDELVRRHEVLRTTFPAIEGVAVQQIAPAPTVSLQVIEVSDLSISLTDWLSQEAESPFDLATGPLIRLTLLRQGERRAVLAITMHHIISDGWSVGVLIQELTTLYDAYRQGQKSPLPPLTVQYADYTLWQRQWLQGDILETQLTYWQQQLADAPALLELPTDHPRPAVQTFRGRTYRATVPPTLSARIKHLSQQQGVTLFMTLLAAFQVLLSRYSRQSDILVGSPIANRQRIELEPLIGFFVNTLVLRTQMDGNSSVKELLQQVKEITLTAYAHQDMPFEQVVDVLQPERSLAHSPIFQVMLALQNVPATSLELADVTFSPLDPETVTAKFDLFLSVDDTAQGLIIDWEYNSDLFEGDTIARMANHFEILLQAMVEDASQSIQKLPLLSSQEQHQVLVEWNDTAMAYPKELGLHELFEKQATATPDAVAVEYEETMVSYGQLNRRADQLAIYLQTLGVSTETLVGICVERSIDMLVALLGVLKVGGAYISLDPDYPRQRLEYMLEDAQLEFLLSQSSLLEVFPDYKGKIVCLDQPVPEALLPTSQQQTLGPVAPENLAYMIYTSGSTGRPKGVQIPHRAVVNFLCAQQQCFQLKAQDRWLAVTSLSFDIAVLELFLPLIVGARVVLASRETAMDGFRLAEQLHTSGATIMQATPATWRMLLNADWAGTEDLRILCGGEALAPDLAAALRSRCSSLWNLYGPTETTIWSIQQEIKGDAPISIGRPIANTQIYILDTQLQPVPVGVPGELHIGGAGLARGYLHQPQLTAEKFIVNPFGAGRLYKTGDLARYRPGGTIEFLGRLDHQIKLRGFRIELSEIEATLNEYPQLEQSVVMVREDSADNPYLVAYVIPQSMQPLEEADSPVAQLQTEQVESWQGIWQSIYDRASESDAIDPSFNIAGWTSSYTGKPIPAWEMKEWVDNTVASILSHRPQRLLEIGCGTGLLLSRIAPHCRAYWATDYSPAVLEQVERLVQSHPDLTNVKLLLRQANDFHDMPTASFDMVVLNSVVQYFPSLEYLSRVIEGGLTLLGERGKLFIGDVRSLLLLEEYHAAVQFARTPETASIEQWQQQVQQSVATEEELVIDPRFFLRLQEHYPTITGVDIQPKRGQAQNELTQFRYDVILRVGQPEDLTPVTWNHWPSEAWTVDKLRQYLTTQQPATWGLREVPNGRLQAACQLRDWLQHPPEASTVLALKQQLHTHLQSSADVDPEQLWTVAVDSGYILHWSCQQGYANGAYDVAFIKTQGQNPQHIQFGDLRRGKWKSRNALSNNPMRGKLTQQLVPKLRQCLQARLPEYMVPSTFVLLEEFPLTPNGKVDRKALPAPASQHSRSGEYAAPQTEQEVMLADLFANILTLSIEQIGVHDSFFELGGHSLLATQLVARLRQSMGVELPLRQLFESPTVADLVTWLGSQSATAEDLQADEQIIVPMSREQPIPLSFAQERLWFVDQLDPGNVAYNQSVAVRFTGHLDMTALHKSLQAIVDRHEILRTTFVLAAGQPIQKVAPTLEASLSVIALDELSPEQQQQDVIRLAREADQQPFDLAQGPLFRTSVLRLNEQDHVLLWSTHHIISDIWSMGVLIRELAELYTAYMNDTLPSLEPLPIQYADFSIWQRQWLTGEVLEQQLTYWRQTLGGQLPVLRLPTDYPAPAVPSFRGATMNFELSAELANKLQALSRDVGATLFMTLLAGFKSLLYAYTGQSDLVVGTDIANRNRSETEGLIGFFINLLLLRTDLSGNPSFRDLIRRVREVALDGYAHQDLPFTKLVQALQTEPYGDLQRRSGATPLFQVLFVMQNTPTASLDLPDLSLTPLELDTGTAKFDLALFLHETSEGISIAWNYSTDRFSEATISRMAQQFVTLLQQAVAQPEQSLEALASGFAQRPSSQKGSKRRKKFKRVAPQSIQQSTTDIVTMQPLPCGVLTVAPNRDKVDLVAWAKEQRATLQQKLSQQGALLFRGFSIATAKDFEQVAEAICPDLFGEYGDLPRTGVSDKVYGSTPYPEDKAILFHNESSHLQQWPMKIWFCCLQPSQQGGETPIVDCRQIYQSLSPEVRDRIQEKQLMYVRNYIKGLDVNWQDFFHTTDRQVVEQRCQAVGVEWEWLEEDGLQTRQVRPAVVRHPHTGEWVVFNQLQLHHLSYLDAPTQASLLSLFGEDRLPRQVYYGDGSPIEPAVLDALQTAYKQAEKMFTWQQGDILMLDNMLMAHGRNPYVGPRKIAVAMGEIMTASQLQMSLIS